MERSRSAMVRWTAPIAVLLSRGIRGRLLAGGSLFSRARIREAVLQAVIAFVAGVLIHLAFTPDHRNVHRPRPRPRCCVLQGHLVVVRIRTGTRESFHQPEVLVRSAIARPVREI